MDRLMHLLGLCKSYKDGKYNVEEFYSRLDTALKPEPETEIGKKMISIIFDAIRELDDAVFFNDEKKANEVADILINAIHKIQ